VKTKLTELGVVKLRPPTTGKYAWHPDPLLPSCGVRVYRTGRKVWGITRRWDGAKHPTFRRIGDFPAMGIGDYRARARAILADPGILEQKQAEAEQAKVDTVATMAAEYVVRHLKRNTRRWRDAERMLARDVLRHWAARPAKDISRRDVLDLTDGIMARSPVSANRVLSLIGRMYNWGIGRGIVEANPAAGIKPPHREHPRDRVLSDDEIRALWATWETRGYPFGTIQQLLLLTAQRRGEVATMRWDQLDLDRGIWRLTLADTKTGKEHVLPLSPQVIEILRQIPRFAGSAWLFPANRQGSDRPVSGFSNPKIATDRLSGVSDWTWHDLRRTAATGMARLNVAPHVCERILNHSGGRVMSAIARVYNVHSYQSEMGHALNAWSREIERIVGRGEAKVVNLR
jgi:integrase